MEGNFDNLKDKELVEATLKDREVFTYLVKRYETQLTRYIWRTGAKDHEEVKDILQESFVKIYINLNDYDPTLSFGAWIYRITHNETINYFRKQKNRPKTFIHENDLILFDMIPDELDIVDEHTKKFEKKAILEALETVPQKYKDVLVLRFFEDKSYDEISDILEIPSGTVATYINRGKTALKEILLHSRALDI